MKKFLFLAFLVASVFAKDKVVVKFSHVVAPTAPIGLAANYLAKRATELSNGRLVVQVFPQSQLMNDSKILVALKSNNIQLAVPTTAKLSTVNPDFQLFDLPFLLNSYSDAYKLADSQVGQKLASSLESKGIKGLAYWDAGFKYFSSSKRPIIAPDDAKGQKFRIQSSKLIEAQISAVGGNSQVMPFSEVYQALAQKVVDASENPMVNFYNSKLYETQKYLTLSRHAYSFALLVTSEKFWQSLDVELQNALKKAIAEATEYERAQSRAQENEFIQRLKTYARQTGKLEIFELPEQTRKDWEAKMQSVYELLPADLVAKSRVILNKK